MSMAAGWYPDPFSVGYERFWDGTSWSSQTRVAPDRLATPVEPAPVQPAPVAAPPYGSGPPAPTADPYGPPPAAPPYGAAPPSAPQQPPWAGYQAYPPPPTGASFPLAPWSHRFWARLIDWMIIAAVMVPLYVVVLWPDFSTFFDSLPTDGSAPDMQRVLDFETSVAGKAFFLGLLLVIAQLVYEVPQLVAFGRTIGKRALGIRVRPLAQDRNPHWGEATGRVSVMAFGQLLLSFLFLLLDCLWPLWDKPWQQALHDKAVKTVVVPK